MLKFLSSSSKVIDKLLYLIPIEYLHYFLSGKQVLSLAMVRFCVQNHIASKDWKYTIVLECKSFVDVQQLSRGFKYIIPPLYHELNIYLQKRLVKSPWLEESDEELLVSNGYCKRKKTINTDEFNQADVAWYVIEFWPMINELWNTKEY